MLTRVWKSFYENGNINQTGYHQKWKMLGEIKSYYENGEIFKVESLS
ncbi:hypothetical protein [Algibacter sp.]